MFVSEPIKKALGTPAISQGLWTLHTIRKEELASSELSIPYAA